MALFIEELKLNNEEKKDFKTKQMLWKLASKEVREKHILKYEKMKQEYEKEYESYMATYGERIRQAERITEFSKKMDAMQKMVINQDKLTDMRIPHANDSILRHAYAHNVQRLDGSSGGQKWRAKGGEKFGNLSEPEKEEFKRTHKKLREKYLNEITERVLKNSEEDGMIIPEYLMRLKRYWP